MILLLIVWYDCKSIGTDLKFGICAYMNLKKGKCILENLIIALIKANRVKEQ